MEIIILILIGITAGILSGMFGIGGGIVIVPILINFLNFSIHDAAGTSLAALLLPVALPAVIKYYQHKLLNPVHSAWIAVGLITGGTLGAWIALQIDASNLILLYAFYLVFASYRFLHIKLPFHKKQAASTPPNTTPNKGLLGGVGVFAGIMSGLFGIGGGSVLVPVMTHGIKMDHKRAVATSLGALMLPVGIGAVSMYYNAGNIDIAAALPLAGGLFAGTLVGAKITIHSPTTIIQRLYAVLLLVTAVRSFIM